MLKVILDFVDIVVSNNEIGLMFDNIRVHISLHLLKATLVYAHKSWNVFLIKQVVLDVTVIVITLGDTGILKLVEYSVVHLRFLISYIAGMMLIDHINQTDALVGTTR